MSKGGRMVGRWSTRGNTAREGKGFHVSSSGGNRVVVGRRGEG